MLAAQATKKQSPAKRLATAGKAVQPKFKAIWEPVNYGKDIDLFHVAFTSALEGWVVGEKNTILHTKDGGKTWEEQLGGDPGSSDGAITKIFFLDANHGWVGLRKLLKTTDGRSWQEVGPVKPHPRTFVSPQTGFQATDDTVQRSDDGGRTWKPVFQCAMDLQIDGLPRKVRCDFTDIASGSPSMIYATGRIQAKGNFAVFARSRDGGSTWSISMPEGMTSFGQQIFFWNETTGLVTLSNSKTLLTADGGETWQGIITPFGGDGARYAMGGGRLGVIVDSAGPRIAYSTDGGRSFSARPFPVPAAPSAVHFPDAQHGYVVGAHGMVYRYVIVPYDYQVARMIPAPMVDAP
jgi:photosystem II stability/assembly factor-like uncharacterized protein